MILFDAIVVTIFITKSGNYPVIMLTTASCYIYRSADLSERKDIMETQDAKMVFVNYSIRLFCFIYESPFYGECYFMLVLKAADWLV